VQPTLVSRFLRAAAAALAVAAYALPLVLGLVADVGHSVHHLAGELQEHRRLAAELGLVHGYQAGSSERAASPAAPGRLVHTHGGTAHSHDAATDLLLIAASQADENDDEDRAPSTLQLSTHVPATSAVPDVDPAPTAAPAAFAASPTGIAGAAPPPPPPRA